MAIHIGLQAQELITLVYGHMFITSDCVHRSSSHQSTGIHSTHRATGICVDQVLDFPPCRLIVPFHRFFKRGYAPSTAFASIT